MAVRRERVILELEDQFTGPLGRAAAATKAFERSLDDLDNTVVRTDRDTTSLGDSNGPIEKVGRQSGDASREIDRFSGRLRLLADTAAILGPALVPIGAVAIPAVTGLAAQFGAAAIAGGTALIAFQGVGEALEAVNKAAIEPSAANLEAAQIAMQNLAPEAAAFVRQIQEMRPAFDALQEAAAAGIFPGLSAALTEAEGSFDNIERVLYAVGDAAGDLAEDFAQGLAGPRGQEFLSFIEAEVPSALTELGHTVGNLAAGMGELWQAFTPLNRDFSGWLLDASRGFDEWADGLARTEGFRDFVAYVRENGPRVADAMGSIGNAVLQIVEAAAPMGGPVLAGLTAVADAIGAIADSGAGPAIMASVTALALLNRGMAAFDAMKGSALFAGLGTSADGAARKMTGMQRAAVGLGGALAGLAVVDALQGGLEDYAIGVESMTRSLLDLDSTAGRLPANLEGIGNSVDRILDPSRAEALQDSISNALGGIGNEGEYDRAVAQIEALDSALASVASTEGIAASERLFTQLGEDAGLTSAEIDRLAMEHLPQYREAIAAAQNETSEFGRAGRGAGSDAAGGFRKAESAAEAFRSAVERANRVLEGRASMRDYQQSIDDLRASIRQNGRTLDINTQKGRDNQAALDAIAETTIKVAETMRGTNRVNFLNQARRDFVDAASKMGIGRQRARELWNQLTQLDNVRAKPTVDVETGSAQAKMEEVARTLRNLDGTTAYTDVVTRYRVVRSSSDAIAPRGRADGGTVEGSRYPYGDRVLTMLAPGEEVISNRHGQADRNRELLRAINANRYANGGTVGMPSAPTVNVGGPNVNVAGPAVRVFIGEREVRALVRSEITADREFERQMGDV